MTSFSKIVFGFLLLALPNFFQGQVFCCDPDAPEGVDGTPQQCVLEDGGYLPADGQICDSDCDGYTEPCTTIPLDGGLSLLAIAGGGLATAAMRRRREEELLEKEA